MTLFYQLRGVLALALIVAFAACESGPGPLGVDRPDPEVVTINGVDLLVMPGDLSPAAGSTSGTIGSSGGALSIDGGTLDVPAFALSGPVQITMEGRIDGLFAYRFGPSGLEFDAPATLTVQVDPAALGVDPDDIKVAGASDEGDDWKVIGGTYDPAAGVVTAQIEHFSVYGLCLD